MIGNEGDIIIMAADGKHKCGLRPGPDVAITFRSKHLPPCDVACLVVDQVVRFTGGY